MFFGGQIVTLGNVSSDIGKVSIVVDIGCFLQLLNDSKIKYMALANPPRTIRIQKSLVNLLVLEIKDIPLMEEDSRNSLMVSILNKT